LTEFEINKEYDTPQHVSDSSSDDDKNYPNGSISKQQQQKCLEVNRSFLSTLLLGLIPF
jgi:hypothetical protein